MDRKRWDIVIPILTLIFLGILIVWALAKDYKAAHEEVAEVVETQTDADVATASEATPDEAKEEPEPTKEVVHCLTTATTQEETSEEITTEVFSATVTEVTTEDYTESTTEEWTEEITEEPTTEEYFEEPAPPEEPQEPEEPSEPSEPEGMTYLGVYYVTGYTATGNATSSGVMPSVGWTAACNGLPMGTIVYIEGIGTRQIQDTGGMSNSVIDVFVGSTSEAYAITGSYEVYIVE